MNSNFVDAITWMNISIKNKPQLLFPETKKYLVVFVRGRLCVIYFKTCDIDKLIRAEHLAPGGCRLIMGDFKYYWQGNFLFGMLKGASLRSAKGDILILCKCDIFPFWKGGPESGRPVIYY